MEQFSLPFPFCWELVLRLAGMACKEGFLHWVGHYGLHLCAASCLVCDLVSCGAFETGGLILGAFF